MSEKYHISGRQIAAARALIGMAQSALADAAHVSIATLRRMEASEGTASGMANNVAAVRTALESEGVCFVAEGEEAEGEGVTLRSDKT